MPVRSIGSEDTLKSSRNMRTVVERVDICLFVVYERGRQRQILSLTVARRDS